MTNEQKSMLAMVLKASLGAGLLFAAQALTGIDFGPLGNTVAMLVSQTIVHAVDIFKLRGTTPAKPAS